MSAEEHPGVATAQTSSEPMPPVAANASQFEPLAGAPALERAVLRLPDGRRITLYRDEPRA